MYFTKLKVLWDELSIYQSSQICTCGCTCGAMRNFTETHQQEHVMKFLIGLNESFSNVRAQIILQDPLPSLNKVFALVTREERQQEIRPAKIENAIFLAKSGSNIGYTAQGRSTSKHVQNSRK